MNTFIDTFIKRIKHQNQKCSKNTYPVEQLKQDDLAFQSHFTAYLNMARQNTCIILGHISQSLGFNSVSVMDTALTSSPILGPKGLLSPKKEVSELVRSRLMSAFPFLDPMIRYKKAVDKEKDDYGKIVISSEDVAGMLKDMLDVLSYYRDMASHIVLDDERTDSSGFAAKEKTVSECLNYMMTVSLRVVKDRFSLETVDLDFYNKNRYSMVNRKPQLNVGFAHAVRTEDYRLTLMGVVLLCCQFIEKQYATMFFDALDKHSRYSRFYSIAEKIPTKKVADRNYVSIFKGEEAERQVQKQRMVLREAYSVYRVRIPKERLDSTRGDMALALDMLNELGKCPDVLFEHLSPEDRESFKGEEGVLMRRNGDRFPQLALKWLDENRKFNNLRFHVTFGKYRWLFCPDKKCVDGQTRQRWLQKELNGFGRIQEVESKRRGTVPGWDGVDIIRKFEDVVSDEVHKDPYVTDFRTQYLFNRDKIGISLNDYMPLIKDIHSEKSDARHGGVPDFYLSVYDIPAMLFLTYLLGDNSRIVEKLLANCKAAYLKLFDDLAEGKWNGNIDVSDYSAGEGTVKFTLGWSDVPLKIRRKMPLLGGDRNFPKKKSFEELAKVTLETMLKRTERQLEKFVADIATARDFKGNKQGKAGFVDIRAGRLANFLARDIVRLMPVSDNGRNKPTGLNYSIIQKTISTYNSSSEGFKELVKVFHEAKIIGVKGGAHPFLESMLNDRKPLSVLDFYRKYLERRIAYLKVVLKDPAKFRTLPFLKAGRQKYSVDQEGYAARLAASYRKCPIYLPDGIFMNLIKQQLNRFDAMKPVLDSDRLNVSYLIAQYFDKVEYDREQPLYRLKRNYRVFDLLEYAQEPKYWELNERVGKAAKYGLAKRNIFWNRMGQYYDGLIRYYEGFRSKKTAVKWNEKLKEAKAEKALWQGCKGAIGEERHKKMDCAFYSRLVNARKEYDDCEREIRRMKVQDMLMFLVARETLYLPKDKVFRLKNLSLSDGTKNILSSTVDEFSMDVVWVEKEDGVKVSHTAAIQENNVVIKNYGRMFKLLSDDRVKTLLPHIHDSAIAGNGVNDRIILKENKVVIDKSLFDDELMHYDGHRHNVCEKVLRFEAAAIKKYGLNGRVDFKAALEALTSRNLLDEKDARVLSAIRNAYNHNKYPVKGTEVSVSVESLPKLTEDLLQIFSSKANR